MFWMDEPDLQRRDIEIEFRGIRYLGHLVAPPKDVRERPLVLVIHNYQGLKFFDVLVLLGLIICVTMSSKLEA